MKSARTFVAAKEKEFLEEMQAGLMSFKFQYLGGYIFRERNLKKKFSKILSESNKLLLLPTRNEADG
jgi:hypothetical protein